MEENNVIKSQLKDKKLTIIKKNSNFKQTKTNDLILY